MPLRGDPSPTLNAERIEETLNRFNVEYILVGGVGAQLHGGTRETHDFDVVVNRAHDNIDRLIGALKELGAFMRADDVSDYDARQFKFDMKWHVTSQEITLWRTDAAT